MNRPSANSGLRIAPIHFQNPEFWEEQDKGFGSLLSILTLGLVGGSPPAGPSNASIQAQMALAVTNQLETQGLSAPDSDISASVGYNLNLYDAWSQVLTNSSIVQEVVNKTITDLTQSGLVTVAPGQANAGAQVSTTGAIVPAASSTTAATASTLTVSPEMLAIAGGGFVLLLLLMGGGHDKQPSRR